MTSQDPNSSLPASSVQDETQQQGRRSLYDDLEDAIQASVWMYLIADLREMAKKNILISPDDETKQAIQNIQTLPATPKDLALVLQSNLENLDKYLGTSKELYLSGIQKWKDRNDKALISGQTSQPGVIVDYDDEKQDSECVYAIAVAHPIKKVVVMFRGSVTIKDWLMNVQAALREIPNPVEEENQPEFVGIHHGFFEYLYGQLVDPAVVGSPENRQRRVARRPDLKNKTQRILGKAALLLEENPGYELYCIGHSLGGALASVFALEAAASADPRIPKPVYCITIGSPKVGDLRYRLAVEALERQNKLRMIRVENQGDAVPLVPNTALNCHKKSLLNLSYHHIGMKLLLFPPRRNAHRLSHPTSGDKGKCRLYSRNLYVLARQSVSILVCAPLLCVTGCATGCRVCQSAVENHGCLSYMQRLEHYKEDLEALYLHDLYDEFLESTNWNFVQ